MPASTHPVRRKSSTRPALLLCAAALALLLGAPRPAHAAGDAPRPSASPAPVAAPATAPAVTPAAAPSPAASPAAAAPTTSTAAATTAPLPAPTVEATPPPDDQGEMEPSPDDAALEDDPTQEQQPQPQTDQDYVFRSMEHRYQYWWLPGDPPSIDNPPAQPMPPEEPMTISYETSGPAGSRSPCERTIKAHVVALDQVFFWNRLGAVQPHGMIFALRHHVVPTDGTNSLKPGKVRLRADKRPRPLVLRMNVGDCLQIDFQNLLAPEVRDDDQPATRTASIHVAGLQLVNSIHDDGSNVGRNEPRPGGLVRPGERITYTLYADGKMREGTHLLFSAAATTTAEGDGGQIPPGLFGAVNVEPRGAEWYRSQLSHNDLRLAARRNADGSIKRTPAGQPVINYDAVYPSWHRYRRQPILKILNRNRVIVHSDLTAIITGPGRGKFPAGTYPPSTVAAPNRDWPFREHTIIYHDEIGAVQAFPQFEQHENPGDLGPTLHGSRDAFAINYGTGGIGAEIIANRIGVGPMANCDECLFEEFFLSSWTVGDPAMVVDVPANAPCRPSLLEDGECHPNQNMPTPGYKATKAFYPHDPSNVYHGYLGDRTKQRVLHAGPKEHHIHHLHAHQWFKAADAEGSSYNDSQAIGPGSGHNIEIAYGGGGNRNLTPGDSIFHCHFYPHFAQGMWALWRVHDVFEEGTELDATGRPVENSARALPDAEIKRGTPIPAVVPIPGGTAPNMADYVMAPMPQEKVRIVNGQVDIQIEAFRAPGNPGFPFFVPGIMGRRVPHPPLDTEFDAGLPRHIILEADVLVNDMNRLSFDKEIGNIHAKELYENGEPIERGAMEYHARDFHDSYRTDGTQGPFMTNGLPPAKGAPFADPCSNPRWTAAGQRILNADPFGRQIYYKGVMFQMDMTINKKGWHFPQSRIESLWDDYTAIKTGFKPPEPLFFRANVNDCVTFHHANLIPKVYRVDDFQVRTPTDIVGQHIHLVKFDVMASDGAGNGWNYEDGTFGPEEVVHRIEEINKGGGIIDRETGQRHKLEPVNHPVFNVPTQVTIQRWLVDNIAGDSTADRAAFDPNRTLRNAFTHDHFGPSTHQQTGLYAGLVIEPEGSDWLDNETGMRLGYGNRPTAVRPIDGGPTSWQAVIIPPDNRRSYREFLLEFADFQLAYMKGRGLDANKQAVPDPEGAINPPGRHEVPLPMTMPAAGGPFGFETRLLERPARQRCETGDPAPCPEILSADDVGTFSVNYRNEPIPLRVRNPATNTQVPGVQGDLSHVYRSIERVDPDLNTTGPLPPLTADVGPYDPFTPLLRAYENDEVQIRVLVGAHEEGHNFTVNGVKWLFEPFDPNSGYRNSQMMGISEKYDFIVPKMPKNSQTTDFLYRPGAASDDQWNGLWGIMRAYSSARRDLTVLPNNPNGFGPAASNAGDFTGVCPRAAPRRDYEVHAYYARDILPRARLEFTGQNGWNFTVTRPGGGAAETGPLNDPTAILYVRREDIGADGKYNRQRVEPLVLRAAAGDCVYLTLRNKLPDQPNDLPGYNTFPMIVDDFNANQVVPSRHVGLHPQLLFYEVKSSDGMNVGRNPVQTAAPGGTVTYQWYAGDVKIDPVTFFGTGVPIEFGATNLMSSDPVKHSNKSAIGSLVVEPQGSNWTEDPDHRHAATVWRPTKGCATCGTVMMPFREFVLQFQNDINMRFASNQPVPNTAEGEDPEDSGQKAFNYRTEPFWARLCYWPALPLTGASGTVAVSCPNGYAQATRQFDMTNSLHNYQIGGRDPVTPIFTAAAGDEVRFRVLHSGGHARNNVFMLHGHVWQEMPYQTGTASTVIGFNNNSPWHGSQYGHGPSNHFDVVVRAGGAFSITGDYLYRTFQSFQFDGGLWGLFRVGGGIPNAEEPPPPPPCAPCTAEEELSPPPR